MALVEDSLYFYFVGGWNKMVNQRKGKILICGSNIPFLFRQLGVIQLRSALEMHFPFIIPFLQLCLENNGVI